MDVISMISKDPSYPGRPRHRRLYGSFSPYVCNGPHVHEYLQEMNRRVLSKYDLLTVGEAGGVTIEEAKKYANKEQTELNMVFQFEHVDCVPGPIGKWSDEKPKLSAFRPILNKWQYELEGKAWNSLYWDNHDQPRVVSRFGNDSEQFRVVSAKMLATCLHMMKGTPYIYQGEEIGMTNVYFDRLEDYRDIESINAYHQYVDSGLVAPEKMMSYLKLISRDNARTPMQWNSSKKCRIHDRNAVDQCKSKLHGHQHRGSPRRSGFCFLLLPEADPAAPQPADRRLRYLPRTFGGQRDDLRLHTDTG